MGIAMYKKRFIAGFVYSVFMALLGPIGILLMVFIRDARPKCNMCGGVIVKGARLCKNCGSEILPFDLQAYKRWQLTAAEDAKQSDPADVLTTR